MTSHSVWNKTTSALEVAKEYADKIRGKNVVVTGVGPIGLGEATALAFASQSPAILILASRTEAKLKKSSETIQAAYPSVNVQIVLLDLSSQQDIRRAATEISSKVDKIDLLINNAGAVVNTRKWTSEHIEYQLGTNHIGPFLLTDLLLPLLKKAAESAPHGVTRIINLASQGHRLSPVRFHDYNLEGKPIPKDEEPAPLPPAFAKCRDDGYNGIIAYAQSKTANILFTMELKKELEAFGIESFSIHPGGVNTDLGRDHDEELAQAMSKVTDYWKTPDEGASTTLVGALDPALSTESSALYLDDCQIAEVAPHASDSGLAKKLWTLSEELVKGT